jgi:hypothetical protein
VSLDRRESEGKGKYRHRINFKQHWLNIQESTILPLGRFLFFKSTRNLSEVRETVGEVNCHKPGSVLFFNALDREARGHRQAVLSPRPMIINPHRYSHLL